MIFALLIGCPSKPPTVVSEGDTDTDTDADSDTDTDTDSDSDRDDDGSIAGVDCDDHDATVFPGAPERCDAKDNDCDGVTAFEVDADLDGQLDCLACDAQGWFAPTLVPTGADLQDVLRTLMQDQSCVSYSSARIFMFNELDLRTDGQVECVYTGVFDTPDGGTTAGVLNTEHTWPQSQGAENEPAKCDLHHLYPTEQDANSRRGNSPFGIVSTATWSEGGSRLGDAADGSLVFEPRPEHRGNVARSLIYFSTQYEYTLDPAYLALLQGWAHDDGVDAAELARTLAIADEQGAANAFVVCPHLVDRL